MLGTPNAKVVVVKVVGNAPLHIPVTLLTAAKVIFNPVESTSTILLNLSVASSGNFIFLGSVFFQNSFLQIGEYQ
ncbi:MAG: hypothetical protein CM15mP113_3480 [Pseudomonadota bacterium]|nr:MAG: hypothetical protein CM15mP113_3480 [Pseudomonadota bacterium]